MFKRMKENKRLADRMRLIEQTGCLDGNHSYPGRDLAQMFTTVLLFPAEPCRACGRMPFSVTKEALGIEG